MYGVVLVVTLLILRENVIIHLNRFKALAIKNISKLFSNVASGRINIRIHRDITGLPGLPDYVIQAGEPWWRARCGLGWGRYSQHKQRFILLQPNDSYSYLSNHFSFTVNNRVINGE